MNKLLIRSVMALAPALILTQALAATDPVPMYQDVVEEVVADDYRAVGEPQRARLQSGEQRLFTFKVPAAGNYLVLAACDDDCYDIDLTLFGGDGQQLYMDDFDDDYPVVYGDDLKAGQTIYAVIGMYDCMNEEDGCQFQLGLFAEK